MIDLLAIDLPKLRNTIILLLLIVTCYSCTKEQLDPTMNCPAFKRGMLERNTELVASEVDKLTEDLLPVPIPLDSVGHLKNITKLTGRMNKSCNFSARGICYLCIPSNPPQSEIEVVFTSAGNTAVMSFTLVVDSAKRLRVVDVF